MFRNTVFPTLCGVAVFLSGCGKGDDSSADQAGSTSSTLPTVSIPSAAAEPETNPSGDVEGSPEWSLNEIKRLKRETLPETKDLDRLRRLRRDRNLRIIVLATETIRQTHQREGMEAMYSAAVHEMLDARTQNAIQGDQDDVEALYSDVGSLERQHPDSEYSVEGALSLVRLAHAKARQHAGEKPEWLTELSRQARLFANRYPSETARSVPLLFSAGRSCELNGQLDDAIPCFELLKKDFPDTRQGQQSFAILRRLNLVGKQVQLEGPTLNGEMISIGDYSNGSTVVYFWSSAEPEFAATAKQLTDLETKYAEYGLRFIGVNLDDTRKSLATYLRETRLPGEQIFFADAGQHRWDNPIARYYGVLDIPQIWLIQADGVVFDNNAQRELESKTRQLLKKRSQTQ